MKIPKMTGLSEAALTAKEIVETVVFGVVMYFVVPYQNYKNRKKS